MNICTNCKHHLMVYPGLLRPDVVGCDRHKLKDPTDGSNVYKRASYERASGEDRCGPEGKFFEPIKGSGA